MTWPAGGVTLTIKNMETQTRELGNAILTNHEQQLVTFKTLNDLKTAIYLQNHQKIRIIDEIAQDIIDLLGSTVIIPPATPVDTSSKQKLAGLLDVDVSIRTDGDFLRWNATKKMFETKADTITPQLTDIATFNNHIFTYGYDANGNVQTVTEKDASNNVIKTVTYTYNASGDVATSVTVMNGKTLTTTYTYDVNGSITGTSNVIS